MRRELKLRAVIPEYNIDHVFELCDLIGSNSRSFTMREFVIPWLLAGNVPEIVEKKA